MHFHTGNPSGLCQYCHQGNISKTNLSILAARFVSRMYICGFLLAQSLLYPDEGQWTNESILQAFHWLVQLNWKMLLDQPTESDLGSSLEGEPTFRKMLTLGLHTRGGHLATCCANRAFSLLWEDHPYTSFPQNSTRCVMSFAALVVVIIFTCPMTVSRVDANMCSPTAALFCSSETPWTLQT